MTTLTNATFAQPAHLPAWVRALEGPMTYPLALDVAEQVCALPVERDWVVVTHQSCLHALERVLAPAAALLNPRRTGAGADIERESMGVNCSREQQAFTAVCATAGYLAWSTGHPDQARAYARAALAQGPRTAGASLAALLATMLDLNLPYQPAGAGLREEVAAAVAAHRAGR